MEKEIVNRSIGKVVAEKKAQFLNGLTWTRNQESSLSWLLGSTGQLLIQKEEEGHTKVRRWSYTSVLDCNWPTSVNIHSWCMQFRINIILLQEWDRGPGT